MSDESTKQNEHATQVKDELHYRQISPAWITSEGTVSMQAFRPTSKDKRKLSLASSDGLTAEDSLINHIARGNKSGGVVGVSNMEVEMAFSDLEPRPEVPTLCTRTIVRDNDPFDGHEIVDFTELTKKECQTVASALSSASNDRGWLFRPARTGISSS